MPSFYNLTSGNVAQSQDVQQIIDALKGTAGLGVPLSPTAVNDSVNFALAVKNLDTTNSRALQVVRANNTVLLQADVNGLIGSVDGVTAPAQLVNLSLPQTLSNKTFNGLIVASGGLQVTSGNVGIGQGAGGNAGIGMSGAILSGAVGQYGIQMTPVASSAATTEHYGVNVQPGTAAAAFTCNNVGSFHATNPAKGAGSTINNAYGLIVEPLTAGNTNNYGVYVNTPSGGSGSNIGIWSNGSAQLGVSGIGVSISTSSPPPTSGLLIGGTDVPTNGTLALGITTNALGGGAAATLGTIGGGGPAAAAQNTWLRVGINNVHGWIPIWM